MEQYIINVSFIITSINLSTITTQVRRMKSCMNHNKNNIHVALAYTVRIIFKTPCLKYFAHSVLNIMRTVDT